MPSGQLTRRRAGERNAATATERASLGFVLVCVTTGQQPHPCSQLGPHVYHLLTGRQQLLGQQVPQAPCALDRPGPLRPGHRPLQQPLHRNAEARTRSSPSGSSAGLIATAVCEPLRGSTPIITAAMTSPFLGRRGPWRACLIPGLALAPLICEARRPVGLVG